MSVIKNEMVIAVQNDRATSPRAAPSECLGLSEHSDGPLLNGQTDRKHGFAAWRQTGLALWCDRGRSFRGRAKLGHGRACFRGPTSRFRRAAFATPGQ
jgi:hypothetical protein